MKLLKVNWSGIRRSSREARFRTGSGTARCDVSGGSRSCVEPSVRHALLRMIAQRIPDARRPAVFSRAGQKKNKVGGDNAAGTRRGGPRGEGRLDRLAVMLVPIAVLAVPILDAGDAPVFEPQSTTP